MPEGQTVMDKNKQGKRAARKLGGQRLDATSSLASFGFAFASVLFPLWLLGFQTHATSDPKEGASGYSRVGRDVIDSAGCQWVGQMLATSLWLRPQMLSWFVCSDGRCFLLSKNYADSQSKGPFTEFSLCF